ncbi:uncharacterized protein LOC120114291 [Hibiscus syriacus]|uniref:uncharacterized protein LOC120114291 n=1 Tax=Hibiscus syriacus TaxID=106335 RepID=UPI001923C116|nr:uncharacterized protein LOC120114291 [Hibiscus syriacus]
MYSALDMQYREEHAIGNNTTNMDEPSDKILKGSSDPHVVEECSEGVGVEMPLQTSKSEDIVLSEGKLHDTSSMPIIDNTLKVHENEGSNIDTVNCTGLESKVNLYVKVASDAIEGLLESGCYPDKKNLEQQV